MWPDAGPYCISIGKVKEDGTKPHWHHPCYTPEQAAQLAKQLESGHENMFLTVGGLVKDKEWFTNEKGYSFWRTRRNAENIRGLRSYIIDIDAGMKSDGVTPREYASVEEAFVALQEFVKHFNLPQPTVVNSGNGLHVYFTLTEEVLPEVWKAHGLVIKEMAKQFGLRIDGGRTADVASVLRIVGCHNYKYDPPVEITVMQVGAHTPTDSFHAQLQLQDHSSTMPGLVGGPHVIIAGSNTTQVRERAVIDFGGLFRGCQVVRAACDPTTQAQTPEPIWNATLMLTRLCGTPEQGRKLSHVVSRNDPRYNAAFLNAKLDRFEKQNMGPSNCATIQQRFADLSMADGCTGCPSRGKITSPAEIARFVAVAPPVVTLITADDGSQSEQAVIEPPSDFVRTERGIAIKTTSTKGIPDLKVFCPYDMYPVRLQYDEKTKLAEHTRWCVNLPHEGWVLLDIPYTSKNQLALQLAKRGMMIDASNIDAMELFMTAYVRKLQSESPREVAYSKMGWRPEGGFVVGDTLYRRDGLVEQHAMSDNLDSATHSGMRVEGEFEQWRDAVCKYNRPGLEGYRTYLYSTFASTIYNMTGQIATCLSATGLGGVGKSTLMDSCAAAWGDPRALVTKGNNQGSTRAAAEVVSDAMQHLPIFLDEISDRDAKDMADFIFNYSGGKGKIRSQAGGGLRADTATWSNLALVNANADEYERMASVFKDAAPHLVRLVQLEFSPTAIISKEEGDEIRTVVQENFGHAGRIFAEYIAKHQTEIKHRVKQYNKEADKFIGAKSEERFWTAWLASMRCAAEITLDLGILPGFPVSADIAWAYDQITQLRGRIAGHLTSSDEMLSEFMDAEISHTLTVAANTGNIDNIKTEPRGGFTVRNEPDINRAWVSRSALQKHCVEHGINMTRHLRILYGQGTVLQENVRKVLGSGTQFAKGNVRCIEIDTTKLSGRAHVMLVPPVTHIHKAATGP